MIDFLAPRWGREELAQRICLLVTGRDTDIHHDCNLQRYQLGCGNDWWLHYFAEGRYRLVYRYWTTKKMAALGTVLEWLLDVELIKGED
jgi:hypothetical protein